MRAITEPRRDFHVRLSTDEKNTLDEAAKAEGFTSAGAFMRHYALMAARQITKSVFQQFPGTLERKQW